MEKSAARSTMARACCPRHRSTGCGCNNTPSPIIFCVQLDFQLVFPLLCEQVLDRQQQHAIPCWVCCQSDTSVRSTRRCAVHAADLVADPGNSVPSGDMHGQCPVLRQNGQSSPRRPWCSSPDGIRTAGSYPGLSICTVTLGSDAASMSIYTAWSWPLFHRLFAQKKTQSAAANTPVKIPIRFTI